MMKIQDGIALAKAVSRLFGWLYVLCWSLSFYPQPLLNWRRRSTVGLAIDFSLLNVVGFTSYTISTAAFFFSPLIKSQYAARHPNNPESTVRFNDFAFALHGAILCFLTYSQFFRKVWGFEVGHKQFASTPVLGIAWGGGLAILVTIATVLIKSPDGGMDANGWAWIDVVYAVSYVKLVVTVAKYIPQLWINYKRKSTIGWSIDQILLDFAGGVLSDGQILIDSSLQNDWSGLFGNPVKFGLGNTAIIIDLMFIVQHYVLYGARAIEAGLGEQVQESVDGATSRIADERTALLGT